MLWKKFHIEFKQFECFFSIFPQKILMVGGTEKSQNEILGPMKSSQVIRTKSPSNFKHFFDKLEVEIPLSRIGNKDKIGKSD